MNPQPKPETHRSKPYRTWLTTQPCVACGQSSVKDIRDVVASHKGGGMAIKGPDNHAVALCTDCHGIEHRAPESFWQSVTLITGKNRDAHVKALREKYEEKGG